MKKTVLIIFLFLTINYSFGQHNEEIDSWLDLHEIFSSKNSHIGFLKTSDSTQIEYTFFKEFFRKKSIKPSDFFELNDLDSLGLIVMQRPFLFSAWTVKLIKILDNKCIFLVEMNNYLQENAKTPNQIISFEVFFDYTNTNNIRTYRLDKVRYLKTRSWL